MMHNGDESRMLNPSESRNFNIGESKMLNAGDSRVLNGGLTPTPILLSNLSNTPNTNVIMKK